MNELPGCSSVFTGSLNGVESLLFQISSRISRAFVRQSLSERVRVGLNLKAKN